MKELALALECFHYKTICLIPNIMDKPCELGKLRQTDKEIVRKLRDSEELVPCVCLCVCVCIHVFVCSCVGV